METTNAFIKGKFFSYIRSKTSPLENQEQNVMHKAVSLLGFYVRFNPCYVIALQSGKYVSCQIHFL